MQRNDLDTRLLDAHAKGDRPALIALYQEASQTAQDADAIGFFLTHAYIFALEAGDSLAQELYAQLVNMGRDF